jgi:hypothetical protein
MRKFAVARFGMKGFYSLTIVGITAAAIALAVSAQAQTVYDGNGATGFGGPVGLGNLTISDTPTSMTVTFNLGSGTMDNDLVVYLDTTSGGFSDTSQFMDGGYGDGGRTAISGYNNGNGPSQTIATFPGGYPMQYAISIENDFIGVFGLAAGGQNSLNYLFGASQSGIDTGPSYSITMTAAQMSQIGLTADSGQTFYFVGSLISESAYRANETIGASSTVPSDGSTPNAGFNGTQTFSSPLSYTLVPEPSSIALVVVGLLGAIGMIRRRKA